MSVKYVRTTVSLPLEVHDSLRATAYKMKQSYGEVVSNWMKASQNMLYTSQATQGKKQKISEYFAELAKTGNDIHAVESVRENRDQ